MKIEYPIYIPTRGRHDTCLTADIFINENIDFQIVVEPNDYDKYCKIYGNNQCIKMPKNNMGIAYVRNYCKKHSKDAGFDYHWQIDDNIKNFRIRQDNKNKKTSAGLLLGYAEDYVNKYTNIGIAGLSHTVFAFSKKNDIDFNKQCYSCVLVNNNNNIYWEDDIVEDTDYSMQVLLKGYCSVLFNRLLIEKATTMTMKGGNTEIEHGKKRLLRSMNLIKKYPKCFTLKKNSKIPRINPSRVWSKFKQRPK